MGLDYKQDIENSLYEIAEEKITNILNNVDKRNITAKELALIHNDRGLVLYKQVKFWKAIEDYDRALKLCENEPAIHYNRSTIIYRMGNYSDALSGFQRAVNLEPSNGEFIEGLFACEQALKQV